MVDGFHTIPAEQRQDGLILSALEHLEDNLFGRGDADEYPVIRNQEVRESVQVRKGVFNLHTTRSEGIKFEIGFLHSFTGKERLARSTNGSYS